jgi:FlaA1/EpsC-like NDP-sugar epimerase
MFKFIRDFLLIFVKNCVIGGIDMGAKRGFLLFFIIDVFIIFSSVLISYLLRFEGNIPTMYFNSIYYTVILFECTTLTLFYFFKVYRRIWQYASITDITLIIKAITISLFINFLLYLMIIITLFDTVIPISIFFLFWMTMSIGICSSRLVFRFIRERNTKIQPFHKKALIVGAGSAGSLVVKELKLSGRSALIYPVAFVDDNLSKLNLKVMGVPVVGTIKDIPHQVKKLGINTIIIAIPSAPRRKIANVINVCKQTRAQIKLLPRVSDILDGKVSINMIRDVHVEDLLGREPVKVNLEEIAGYVTNKTVLVTGAGGSIGSELCRQISKFKPKKLFLLGHGENSLFIIENELKRTFPDVVCKSIIASIQDRKRIEHVFSSYHPDVVFHAAAHKHVPLMESNPTEAIKNNVFGTKNMAECAHQFGAERFVLISSDKVVNPTSIMGTTKHIAEMLVQYLDKTSNTKFVAVRFGNVLESRGSVVPLFKQQIQKGGPVTVTHPDMVRYFMTIPEAVQLVIQAGTIAQGGEIFVLDMGEPVKISKLARDLIRLSGLQPDKDIKIEYTGIRPGEKLFEELLTSEELTTATKHDLIYVAKPSDQSQAELLKILTKLEQAVSVNSSDLLSHEVKTYLAQLVPTFTQNNT